MLKANRGKLGPRGPAADGPRRHARKAAPCTPHRRRACSYVCVGLCASSATGTKTLMGDRPSFSPRVPQVSAQTAPTLGPTPCSLLEKCDLPRHWTGGCPQDAKSSPPKIRLRPAWEGDVKTSALWELLGGLAARPGRDKRAEAGRGRQQPDAGHHGTFGVADSGVGERPHHAPARPDPRPSQRGPVGQLIE